jgi:tetratricopeptide (TPR) repeat protein
MKQRKIIESNMPSGFSFKFKLSDPEDDFIMSTDIKSGLKELFSHYELPGEINISGIDDVKKYYQSLSKRLGFTVNISDRILRDVAHNLKQKKNLIEARRIFKYILELYPKSLDGLFQMAEMMVSSGRYKEAINYYSEFLKLRPQEVFIKNRLKSLKKIVNESAAYEIEQVVLNKGLAQGLQVYQQLKKNNASNKYFNENEFIRIGYSFLARKRINEAVEIFKMSVELFPESFNTWDSLGEAYMKKGDKEKAVKNYQKSLELNPKNENARKMFKKLGRKK